MVYGQGGRTAVMLFWGVLFSILKNFDPKNVSICTASFGDGQLERHPTVEINPYDFTVCILSMANLFNCTRHHRRRHI
jgi:hypothetical protein